MQTETGRERKAWQVGEVAEQLGVDPQTVRTWIATGVLDAVQPGGAGGRFLVPAASLDRLLGRPVAAGAE